MGRMETGPIALDDLKPGDELTQSALWGRFKQRFGWCPEPVYWVAGGSGGTLLSLTRATPFGPLVYVPGAPAAPPAHGDAGRLLADLAPAITLQNWTFASGVRATVVRYDLPWPVTPGEPPTAAPDLRRAPVEAQPTSTVLVTLLGQEDRLLARMKSKTRENIRLAHHRGVGMTVTPAAAARGAALADWYCLYRATAARYRIAAHSERYFATLFDLAASVTAPELFLLSARSQDELLGGIIVSVCGRMARFLYGASAPCGRELMANYALQWAAIRLARARRCLTYDLYGIPTSPDPSHPWAGLYRFKTGFGGEIVHRWGSWDCPMNPFIYPLLRRAESLRQRCYSTFGAVLPGRLNAADFPLLDAHDRHGLGAPRG